MKKTWITSSAAAVLFAASLLASPAKASFPGANGLIAYDGFVGFQAEIFVVNQDGSFATNITQTPDQIETSPSFSADGTRLVYTRASQSRPSEDIWISAVDGSGAVQVTDTERPAEIFPTFSPDGTQIAFLALQPRGAEIDLMIIDADGTDARSLTSTGDISFGRVSWSPDGSKIAYARAPLNGGKGGIYTVDVATGTHTALTSTGTAYHFDPDWSPDGTKIAFTHSPPQGFQQRRVMDADGSDPITVFEDDRNTFTFMATWAPDGSGLLVSGSEDRRPVIAFIDLATRTFDELMVQDGFNLSWQPCTSPCAALSTPASSQVEIGAYSTRRAIFAVVRVIPLHPGERVQLTFSRRTDGGFRKVTSKSAVLGDGGFGNIRLPLFKSGRCRIEVSWAGDGDHSADSDRLTKRCNRFTSAG